MTEGCLERITGNHLIETSNPPSPTRRQPAGVQTMRSSLERPKSMQVAGAQRSDARNT